MNDATCLQDIKRPPVHSELLFLFINVDFVTHATGSCNRGTVTIGFFSSKLQRIESLVRRPIRSACRSVS
jgi:hypothetical protein